MLHSDIVPEYSCDCELIPLDGASTYLQIPRCSSCGTECAFEPDSDWVTVVLPGDAKLILGLGLPFCVPPLRLPWPVNGGQQRGPSQGMTESLARVANYQIPSDGRVTITVPAFRPYCGVYLFNWIKVGGGGDDALKAWKISVLRGVGTVRTLSLKDLKDLPTDPEGYRLLKIPD